jgi:nitroreductase
MELRDAILNRRTIRQYNDQEISREEIIELLEDAIYAPTHHMRQTWRFILIDGEDKEKLIDHLEQIYQGVDPKEAQLEYRKKSLIEAKMILVVVNEKDHPDPIWMLEEYGAASTLIHNFQLLAYERGIGMCWKSHFFLGKPGQFLGVQDYEMISGVLTIGRFDEAPAVKPRIKAKEKLTIFKFDESKL